MVLVSSRASFEMVQKTAAAGVPVLAAVSAPTALACGWRKRPTSRSWASCATTTPRLYAHPERIFPDPDPHGNRQPDPHGQPHRPVLRSHARPAGAKAWPTTSTSSGSHACARSCWTSWPASPTAKPDRNAASAGARGGAAKPRPPDAGGPQAGLSATRRRPYCSNETFKPLMHLNAVSPVSITCPLPSCRQHARLAGRPACACRAWRVSPPPVPPPSPFPARSSPAARKRVEPGQCGAIVAPHRPDAAPSHDSRLSATLKPGCARDNLDRTGPRWRGSCPSIR